MKKQFSTISTVLILSFLAACSASKVVVSDVNKNVDFSTFKTYHFPGINANAEISKRENRLNMIIDAIDREMALRGYSKSSDDPDLLLNVGIVIEERIQTRETDIREAPTYMGTRNYHWESQEVEVGRYLMGSVLVDMVDLEDNSMIWHSVVEQVVKQKTDDEKAKKNIDDAIVTLFKKFPVAPAE